MTSYLYRLLINRFFPVALTGALILGLTVQTALAAAPVVDAGAGATIVPGGTFTGEGFFTDPDANTWTAKVDYDEGAGLVDLDLNADKTFALSNVYEIAGTYTVTVVVDDGTATGSDTLTVNVNTVPVVNAGAGDTIVVGGTFDGAGFFTDPDTDTWTAKVDYDEGAGLVDLDLNADKTFALSNVYENPGTYTVTVTVNDGTATGSDTLTVNVDTVPVVNAGAGAVLLEGEIFTRAASFTDPDADTWTVTINYGEGDADQTFTTNSEGTINLSNLYENAGEFTVTVTVDDGSFEGSDTFGVLVLVPPPGRCRRW